MISCNSTGSTCWEGNAVQLAQNAEVAQCVAVIPGCLAQGAVDVHIRQVHNTGCHDFICVCLHLQKAI